MSVNEQLEEAKEKLALLTGKVESWMASTDEYRKAQTVKVDLILDKLAQLPCKERKGFYESANTQFKLLWLLVGGIFVSMVLDFFKYHK